MVRLLWFILPQFCVYFDSREKRRRVPVKDITTGGAALFWKMLRLRRRKFVSFFSKKPRCVSLGQLPM
uniref:Uncharacterized protein n=1 Tax=Daphnia magna TaxID=35525 RepID=A0A0P6CTT0_9CRUS